MKKVFIWLLAFFLLLILIIGSLQIFGIVDFKGRFISTLKSQPTIGKMLTTRDEVTALEKQIAELENTVAVQGEDLADLQQVIERKDSLLQQRDEEIARLQSKLQEREEQEADFQERVSQLAAIYSEVDPAKAAEVFQKLDNKLIIAIMQEMGEKESAEILGSLQPELAAEITRTFSTERR